MLKNNPRHLQSAIGALGAAAALLVAVAPASAQDEMLTPHLSTPATVTPHEVGRPVAVEPSPVTTAHEAPPSAEMPSESSAAAAPADRLDGPKPSPEPEPKPCNPKPGHICPYFCPEGTLQTTCTRPPILIPNYRHFERPHPSMDQFLQTVHLCAANRPVAFMLDFYYELAQGFGIVSDAKQFADLLEAAGVPRAELGAYVTFHSLNCVTFVES